MIPMLQIRWSCDRVLFNMGIPIPGKDGLYIETGNRFFDYIQKRPAVHQLLPWILTIPNILTHKQLETYRCVITIVDVDVLKLRHHTSTDSADSLLTCSAWWCHQMETFSPSLALCEGNLPITGGFPSQRPVRGSFDVFFDLCLNTWLSKQSRCQWFEMPLCSLWHHCNGISFIQKYHKLKFYLGKITELYKGWYSTWYWLEKMKRVFFGMNMK